MRSSFWKLAFTVLICSVGYSAKSAEHDFYYPYFIVDGYYYNPITPDSPSYVPGINQAFVTYGPEEYYGDVTIPETVSYNGVEYIITGITFEAFKSCRNLTSVNLPSTLTGIGVSAFEDCVRLPEIRLPGSLTGISGRSFKGCTSLKKVIIEDSDTYLPFFENTFDGCDIEEVYIGRDLGFYWLDDEMSERSYSPFRNKASIKVVTFGNPCTYIDTWQFSGCTGLEDITIPETLGIIYSQAFKGCSSLKTLKIEDSDEIIGIYDDAFTDCPIQQIYIGRNLGHWYSEEYGEDDPDHGIFSGLNNLKSLTDLEFGPKVTYLDYHQFEGCSSLTSVNLTDNITRIGAYAFKGCVSLEKTVLGNSTVTIEKDVFKGCENIKTVACKTAVPPTAEESSFPASAYANALLEVPTGSAEIYSATFPWSKFNMVEGTDNVQVEKCLSEGAVYPVFTLNGMSVRRDSSKSGLDYLTPGVYIVGGKKIIVK